MRSNQYAEIERKSSEFDAKMVSAYNSMSRGQKIAGAMLLGTNFGNKSIAAIAASDDTVNTGKAFIKANAGAIAVGAMAGFAGLPVPSTAGLSNAVMTAKRSQYIFKN